MQLFGPALPDGLTIIEEFLTVAEHDNCLREIDSQPWSTDLNRRTQHYGSKYDYTTGKAIGAGSAPDPPAPLRAVEKGAYVPSLRLCLLFEERGNSQGQRRSRRAKLNERKCRALRDKEGGG